MIEKFKIPSGDKGKLNAPADENEQRLNILFGWDSATGEIHPAEMVYRDGKWTIAVDTEVTVNTSSIIVEKVNLGTSTIKQISTGQSLLTLQQALSVLGTIRIKMGATYPDEVDVNIKHGDIEVSSVSLHTSTIGKISTGLLAKENTLQTAVSHLQNIRNRIDVQLSTRASETTQLSNKIHLSNIENKIATQLTLAQVLSIVGTSKNLLSSMLTKYGTTYPGEVDINIKHGDIEVSNVGLISSVISQISTGLLAKETTLQGALSHINNIRNNINVQLSSRATEMTQHQNRILLSALLKKYGTTYSEAVDVNIKYGDIELSNVDLTGNSLLHLSSLDNKATDIYNELLSTNIHLSSLGGQDFAKESGGNLEDIEKNTDDAYAELQAISAQFTTLNGHIQHIKRAIEGAGVGNDYKDETTNTISDAYKLISFGLSARKIIINNVCVNNWLKYSFDLSTLAGKLLGGNDILVDGKNRTGIYLVGLSAGQPYQLFIE